MLVSLLFLYDAAPGHSFAMGDMADGGRELPLNVQLLIFAGLFIGFGVKMPVFPLHGWLPLAHVEAPSPVSILLSGILLKMGAYGLIRAAEILPAARDSQAFKASSMVLLRKSVSPQSHSGSGQDVSEYAFTGANSRWRETMMYPWGSMDQK